MKNWIMIIVDYDGISDSVIVGEIKGKYFEYSNLSDELLYSDLRENDFGGVILDLISDGVEIRYLEEKEKKEYEKMIREKM